ncbi:hypothetical protein G3N59_10590 [Paraburkholderia sp. Ac-20340]|uniref:hypothetical protein n=1 Tax=Paraburkholderia sp. Ac-20340 TaxID=2703888 RepID=UPI0019802E02|nr:hypothetical protein [Paraburkholderia sp. Ac-20340]MBN3853828.1 hypothetical protein [Paraburkholderia sp. Ac-20340]
MGILDALAGGATRGYTADVLGTPVDLSADAINGLTSALGQFTPVGFPQITDPVGGSAWIAQRMRDAGLLSDQPGTAGDALGGLIPLLAGPVKPGALADARTLLEALQSGQRAKPIELGSLTADQLQAINDARGRLGQPQFTSPDVFYKGTHHYNSRVTDQDPPYSIDDMLQQIQSGLSDQSVVVNGGRSPVLQNPNARVNESGVPVNDAAVLNSSPSGKPELFSVIPRGDGRKKKGP